MSDSHPEIEACYNCVPGDVLVTSTSPPFPGSTWRPSLCKAAGINRDVGSGEIKLRDLPFGAHATVIYPNGLGWVYVVCDGSVGWVNHTSISHKLT